MTPFNPEPQMTPTIKKPAKTNASISMSDLAVEMLTKGPQSICSIADESQRRGLSAPYPSERAAHCITAHKSIALLGCTPILDTPQKVAVFEYFKINHCLDGWLGGEGQGQDLFDSILWFRSACAHA